MKKHYRIYFSFILAILVASGIKAQVFEKGTKVVDAGFQLQDEYVPFFLNFEAGVTDQIGIGMKAFIGSMKDAPYTKYNLTSLQLVGTYHLNDQINLPVENLDVFGAIGVGIINIKTRFEGFGIKETDSQKGFLVTPHIGARYYFSDKLGVNAKVGMDIYKLQLYNTIVFKTVKKPNVSLGIAFKF